MKLGMDDLCNNCEHFLKFGEDLKRTIGVMSLESLLYLFPPSLDSPDLMLPADCTSLSLVCVG